MMLLIVTLSCVALWWWQKPFDVETVIELYSGRENGQPVLVEGRRVERMRRKWGDDNVRHGATREYDHLGNLMFEEHWRQGRRHGLYRRWDLMTGELIAELEFERGRLVRVGDTLVQDFMLDMVAESAAEDRIKAKLLEEAFFHYTGQPLKDVVSDISFQHTLEIAIDTPALRTAGIPVDSPVTIDARGMPLFAALCVTLAPLELTCAHQYEMLWITTSDTLLHERSINLEFADAQLLGKLNQPAVMDYLDKPLRDVLSDVSSRYEVAIFDEINGHEDLRVTFTLHGSSLRATLGALFYLHGLSCEADNQSLLVRLVNEARQSAQVTKPVGSGAR